MLCSQPAVIRSLGWQPRVGFRGPCHVDDAIMSARPQRILLGHLVAFGDCLYATVIARQLKQDVPGCHLTWAIASPCREIIEGNPYVDEIWELPFSRAQALGEGWRSFTAAAEDRLRRGEFDRMYFHANPSG